VASAANPSAAERTPRKPTTAHTATTLRSIFSPGPTELFSATKPLSFRPSPVTPYYRSLLVQRLPATASKQKQQGEEKTHGDEKICGGFVRPLTERGPGEESEQLTEFFSGVAFIVRPFASLRPLPLGARIYVGPTRHQQRLHRRVRGAWVCGRSTVDAHERAGFRARGAPLEERSSGGARWTRCTGFCFACVLFAFCFFVFFPFALLAGREFL
jgi:hypothetical protein